jgi:cell division initiation protein
MSITPLDIQDKEFERGFRGYDIEDVDEFLDQIAKDLEVLLKENAELKEQVNQLIDKNKNYQQLEETMHSAIVVAQKAANEVKETARRDAESIRLDAEREARQIIEDARQRSGKVVAEHEVLVKEARLFKTRFRSFIENQIALLDGEKWIEEPSAIDRVSELTREFEAPFVLEQKNEKAPEVKPDLAPEPEPKNEPEEDTFELDIDTDYGLEDRDLDADPKF